MTIKDVCLTFSDGDWIESKDQSECGIRLIQTGNVGNGEFLDKPERAKYVSEETYSRLNCTEIFPGDILVSRLPDPIGRACIIPESSKRMITAVDCTICRPDEDIILKEYLCYYMQSSAYYSQLMNSVTGTTRKRISRSNLGSVEVPVPDRSTQKSVVEKFDRLNTLIRARKEELAKLDNLIKARFVEMMNANPTHNKLSEFITSYKAERCGDRDLPILSITKEDGIVFQSEKFKKRIASVDASAYKVVPKGKLVQGIHIDERNFAIQNITDEGIVSPAYKIWDVDVEKANPEVLAFALRTDRTMAYIGSKFTGSVKRRESIGLEDFMATPIDLPDISVQDEFSRFMQQVDKSKSVVQKSLDETQLLLESLMQKYFN